MRAHGRGHALGLLVAAKPLQAHEQNAGVQATLPKHQFSEILVAGHQQCTKAIRLRQDVLIRQARRELGDIGDVVGALAKASTMPRSTPSSQKSFKPLHPGPGR